MIQDQRRPSEEKYVLSEGEHAELFPAYVSLIKKLKGQFNVIEDPNFEELVNFERNRTLPIHAWFDYKQGYSKELVEKLLSTYPPAGKDSYVLDPFAGVGTTLVTAQRLGIKSVGLEINPIASFAAKVKTYQYTGGDLVEIKSTLAHIEKKLRITHKVPKYQRLTSIFTQQQLEQILKIKGFYEDIESSHIRDFFKLAYLSIIEDCSNRIKDGNGIKIARNKPVIEFVLQYFVERCQRMIRDLEKLAKEKKVEGLAIHGSILEDNVLKELRNYTIGSVIFSPPYANCFDYCEVYKMEIWLGDFVDDYDDFTKYRSLAVRSHVNASFDHTIAKYYDKVDIIASLIGTYNIWNRNIPDMIRGYFDDMRKVLSRLFSLLQNGGYCSIIVANSSYKGVIVPTDLLLADIAESLGFKVIKVISARRMRASSQQMIELKEQGDLMRESIIILQKPSE